LLLVGQPDGSFTRAECRDVLRLPPQQHLELALREGQAHPNGAGVRICPLQYLNASIRKTRHPSRLNI
jgi:hypothetical protein